MLTQYVLLITWLGWCQGSTLWSWYNETKSKDIMEVLRQGFGYSSSEGKFGVGSDDSLSLAPSPSHDGTYVLRVFYQKGTFSGHDHNGSPCKYPRICRKGAQFYAHPAKLSEHTRTTLTLEYDVWFDHTFKWNIGGKLPGLWGGTRECSGGTIVDSCFSTRLMWREDGNGEVYAYVTHQQGDYHDFCHDYDHMSSHLRYKQIHCTPSTGIALGAGTFKFETGKWIGIRQEVHLNSASNQPGYVKLWVKGHAEINVHNIIMRHSNSFDIDGLFFSTFYGGHNASWACPHDTYTYFRNFRITTDKHTASQAQLVG